MNGGMAVFVSGGMRSAVSRDTLPEHAVEQLAPGIGRTPFDTKGAQVA